MSATPQYGCGSPKPEGTLFEWLVSDFSVYDAFGSGLVKVVRLPNPDPANQGRQYIDLWTDVRWAKSREEYQSACKGAIASIHTSWRRDYDDWQQTMDLARNGPSPVMLVVADRAERAIWLFEHLTKDYGLLRNPEDDPLHWVTIQVDSGVFDAEKGKEVALRSMVSTVGRKGMPGEHVRCIVSVNMLSEGWDVKSVRHIIGLRAFGSPLLTEQINGNSVVTRCGDPGSTRNDVAWIKVSVTRTHCDVGDLRGARRTRPHWYPSLSERLGFVGGTGDVGSHAWVGALRGVPRGRRSALGVGLAASQPGLRGDPRPELASIGVGHEAHRRGDFERQRGEDSRQLVGEMAGFEEPANLVRDDLEDRVLGVVELRGEVAGDFPGQPEVAQGGTELLPALALSQAIEAGADAAAHDIADRALQDPPEALAPFLGTPCRRGLCRRCCRGRRLPPGRRSLVLGTLVVALGHPTPLLIPRG